MYRRSSDSERQVQSGSTSGRESSASVQSSPVETIHRQVGNQAVQSGYAEEEYPGTAGRHSVTIPAVSMPDKHGPMKSPDRHGPLKADRHGPMKSPDRHGPLKSDESAVGSGNARVPGWQSVTIPGKSVSPGATGAAGQQVSGDREIERVKNRLWGQFESIIDDALR